ncbi:hypothetical protein [Gluconobacter wancherniae]|nr:hypothetical protein [Gluconobacter wancherniae]MBF0853322.1 hypothetical protein [Gluconobacter wancherniae]GBD55945.1 hypothetical protein NBRC103581_00517 [Gluconobacter wancherniae NBRC 103581]
MKNTTEYQKETEELCSFNRKKFKIEENKKYIESIAEHFRDYSQYLIAIMIFISLILRVFIRFSFYNGPSTSQIRERFYEKMGSFDLFKYNVEWFLSQNTLSIIGDGLALSAGIDLAYMLFTPGPDEVIAPLLTALSATIVLIISNDERLNLSLIFGVFILIIGMILLMISGYLTGLIAVPEGSEDKNFLLLLVKRKVGKGLYIESEKTKDEATPKGGSIVKQQ